ncbi:MAG TPA: ATP-binding protein [Candidatus Limnocylindrales bacterium]|nr:ATP-binding protein [Candidatus Limnocylindrales bacterium]
MVRPLDEGLATRPTLELPLRTEADVAVARLAARSLGRGLELPDGTATRFATAVSEVSRNAVVHAGGGSIAFALDIHGRVATLLATVVDDGPGIPDVEAAMIPRLGDPAGTGVGLSRARRLVDDLRIAARGGGGTLVQIVRSVPNGAAERWDAAVAAVESAPRIRATASSSPQRAADREPRPSDRGDGAALAAAQAEITELREERTRLAAELEETNRGVVALYAELEDQAQRLRHADELKSRFLSRVSHELRTPINSIVALSRLLADRVDGELSDGQATQVGYIQSAAGDLSVLVNDLLDLARIESGRVDVYAREFLVETLFSGLRGTLRPLAKPGVDLRFVAADTIPPLFTDEGKVAQIVRNFVSNALKFTFSGSVTITPQFAADRGRLRIEVTDTGIGIAAEHLDRIFDEFVQVTGSHQVGVKGSGLGLSVSRGLAGVLGGEVGATSTLGEGSTFWVEIPAIHAAGSGADDAPTDLAAGPTVLVVDDDPTARYLVRHQLAPHGLRLIEAATGAAGLDLVRAERPAVVVLDLTMPDADGLDILAELRADRTTRTLPVIVHTGRELTAGERHRIEAANAQLVRKDAAAGAIAIAVQAALAADPRRKSR